MRVSHLSSTVALLCALTAMSVTAHDVTAQDVILTKSGKRIRGVEVVEMTTDSIKYRRGETELELPANLLTSVQWSETPEAFALAQSAINKGDFAAAAEHFTTAAKDARRAPLKLESRYLAGMAMLQAAGSDALKARTAVDALQSFLADAPTHYRVPDATLHLGRAQLAAGDAAAAAQTLRKLADDSLAKNWDPIWDARAKFELARAMTAQGDYGNARATFRGASQAADQAAGGKPNPELEILKAQAKVGEGETFVREGKYDDALQFFRSLASSTNDSATKAAAKAGQGEALYLKAAASDAAPGLRAAQIALAEANLYDVAAADTTAKSLYYSAKVILALGPDREASNYKTRAMDYLQTVTDHYPSTDWAVKAREELQR